MGPKKVLTPPVKIIQLLVAFWPVSCYVISCYVSSLEEGMGMNFKKSLMVSLVSLGIMGLQTGCSDKGHAQRSAEESSPARNGSGSDGRGKSLQFQVVSSSNLSQVEGHSSSGNMPFQKYLCKNFSIAGQAQQNRTMLIETIPFYLHYFDDNDVFSGLLVAGKDSNGYQRNCGLPLPEAACHSTGKDLDPSANLVSDFSHYCEYDDFSGNIVETNDSKFFMQDNGALLLKTGQYTCDQQTSSPLVFDFSCKTVYDHGVALPLRDVGQGVPDLKVSFSGTSIQINFQSGLSSSELDPYISPLIGQVHWNLYSTAVVNTTGTKGYMLRDFSPLQRVQLTNLGTAQLIADASQLNGAFAFPDDLKDLHLVIATQTGSGGFIPKLNIPLNLYCTAFPQLFTDGTNVGCPGL